MKSRIFLGALALTVSTGVIAQEPGPYLGLNATHLESTEEGVEDLTFNSIVGRVGGFFNPYVGAEFRWGYGVNGDSTETEGLNVSLELDDLYGGYIKGGVPIGDMFYPYAIVGYTEQEVTARATGVGAASDSVDDMSYGVGIDMMVGSNVGINIEYMSLIDKDDAEVEGISIGVFTRM